MDITGLTAPYRIERGKGFRLKDVNPADTQGLDLGKKDARELLKDGVERLKTLQEMLYAQDRWAVLLIFQAMDAAGKDSAIEHVMSGVDPQGCQVFSFKAPSSMELDHDFMWRTTCCLPERGRVGIFNRSYYEEVLIVRVHPEILAGQKVPKQLVTSQIWDERFEDIRAFERFLSRNGTVIRKFFLHVSKEEQKKRFLERLDEPAKNWKFSAQDVAERRHWNDYMRAYEEMIQRTSTPEAPWYVVPADQKWFTRLVVAAAIVETLKSLDLSFPTISSALRREHAAARAALLKENRSSPATAPGTRRSASAGRSDRKRS